MNKFSINFGGSIEKANITVGLASDIPCDINIFYGSLMFDCKSLIAVINLDLTKDLVIEMLTEDEDLIDTFKSALIKVGVINV